MAETLTLAAVLERLRAIYGVTSDEDLARKLDKPLRTLARHKKKEPDYFPKVVALLDAAQLIKRDPVEPLDPNRILQAARRLAEDAEELVDLLQ